MNNKTKLIGLYQINCPYIFPLIIKNNGMHIIPLYIFNKLISNLCIESFNFSMSLSLFASHFSFLFLLISEFKSVSCIHTCIYTNTFNTLILLSNVEVFVYYGFFYVFINTPPNLEPRRHILR